MSGRVEELTKALQTKTAEMETISAAFKIEDNGGVVVSQEMADAYRKAFADANEIKGLLDIEKGNAGLQAYLAEPEKSSLAVAAAAAAAEGGGGSLGTLVRKTLGKQFTESEEFKALKASGGLNMQSPWNVDGADLGSMWTAGQKDVYSTLPTGPSIAPAFGPVQFDPMVPMQQRTARVRDLFPVQGTNAALIDFFRVTGFTNAASVVPERAGGVFALKPQSALAFVAVQAPVRTIANWEVAHRNVLADEPQLQGIINNELLYGLRLHEDYQILQGTGTSEDLLGILVTPGIQSYAQSSGPGTDNAADAIRRAATRSILAYYEPNGVVVHPYDWEGIELQKDSQNRYLITTQVAVGAQKTLWRMNVVDTPAIPQKTSLVGSFGLGAQLYDREQGTIRIAEQHSDFFVRNAVVVLAEERLALAVKRPESFVKVTLS